MPASPNNIRVRSMLKIVYPVCFGIDVHKKFVVATIATTNDKNVTSYQTRRFNNFKNDLNLSGVPMPQSRTSLAPFSKTVMKQ